MQRTAWDLRGRGAIIVTGPTSGIGCLAAFGVARRGPTGKERVVAETRALLSGVSA